MAGSPLHRTNVHNTIMWNHKGEFIRSLCSLMRLTDDRPVRYRHYLIHLWSRVKGTPSGYTIAVPQSQHTLCKIVSYVCTCWTEACFPDKLVLSKNRTIILAPITHPTTIDACIHTCTCTYMCIATCHHHEGLQTYTLISPWFPSASWG